MIEMKVNPREVWRWCRKYKLHPDPDLAIYIAKNGWSNIPRVPIFEIPQEYRRSHYRYIVIDGNKRTKIARLFNQNLPALLYQFEETINPQEHRIAPFGYSKDERVYIKLLTWYVNYKEIMADMAKKDIIKN